MRVCFQTFIGGVWRIERTGDKLRVWWKFTSKWSTSCVWSLHKHLSWSGKWDNTNRGGHTCYNVCLETNHNKDYTLYIQYWHFLVRVQEGRTNWPSLPVLSQLHLGGASVLPGKYSASSTYQDSIWLLFSNQKKKAQVFLGKLFSSSAGLHALQAWPVLKARFLTIKWWYETRSRWN